MKIEFEIPGRIKGWQRARYNSKTGAVFPHKELLVSQGVIKDFGNRAMGERRAMLGPIRLHVEIYIARPKAKEKRTAIYYAGFPDHDNLFKTIGDSLNHIVWDDDRQIADSRMVRRYTDGKEFVRITVEQLEPPKETLL